MTRLLAVLSVFALSVAVVAAPPTPSPVSTDLLIEQLGSELYAEREAAAAALEKAGASAIPALESAARSPSPEISKRANHILANLRRNVDSKDRFKPKLVRVSYKQIPLGTAVNDLKAHTGINLALDAPNIADPLRLVTCETGELPPWEAVAAFCAAAGLKEVFDAELPVPKQDQRSRRGYYQPLPAPPLPEAVPVKLTDGKAALLPANRSTAVRITALPAAFPKHKVYLGTGEVLLHFDVAPIPGLNWRDVTGIRITKVVDSADRLGAGSTVKDPGPAQNDYNDGVVFLGGGGMVFRGGWDGEMSNQPTSYPNPRIVPVPIKVATPSARSLKLLEGAVVCEVALPNQVLATIDNIAANPGVPATGTGGTKLTMLEMKADEKGGKAILKIQTEAPAPWLLNRRFNAWGGNPWGGIVGGEMAVPATPVKGFDPAGKPVRLNTLTNSQTNNDEFTMTMVIQFACPDGLPTKLVLMGSKPVMVEVPFKMENVPLP